MEGLISEQAMAELIKICFAFTGFHALQNVIILIKLILIQAGGWLISGWGLIVGCIFCLQVDGPITGGVG